MSEQNKIRILFLCNSPAVMAGVEKTVLLLLRDLDRDLFDVRVILSGDGPFAERLRALGTDLEIIAGYSRWNPLWYLRLYRSLRRRPADVVMLHISRLNAPVLHRAGCKVVERLNMTRHDSSFYFMRLKKIDCCTARWIDRFVVVSDSLRKQFLERGYPAEKLTSVYNGIDMKVNPDREKLRKELSIPKGVPIVGTVARLTRQKGVDVFLAAAHLITDSRDVQFVIAGDGEERSKLEDLSRMLKIQDRVHFLGYRTDAPDMISGMDVFVYLSRWEPFANTLLEAMAAGVPIVASDVGGNSELIQKNVNGCLVGVREAERAAKEICSLLDEPGKAAELVQNAERTVEEFSVEKMTRQHEQVFKELSDSIR